MKGPLPSGVRDFDLRAEARRNDRNRLYARVLMIVLGGVFIAVGFSFILPAPSPFGYFGAAVFWVSGAVFLGGALLIRVPAPVNELTLTPDGVTLRFEDGGEQVQRWDDPRFGLTLRDYSIDVLSTKGEKREVLLLAPGRRFGLVSHEIAAEVALAARARSLTVTEREEVVAGGKFSHRTTTTRIGRIEGTPEWKAS